MTEPLPVDRLRQLQELQQKLNYSFTRIELLHEATCHNSWLYDGNERTGSSYERMEFLGDLIISFIIGDYLFHNFSDMTEADYSRIRAQIVSGDHLFLVGQKLHLGNYILMSRGEELNDGRNKKSIVSNVIEAIMAAIYLDSNLQTAQKILIDLLEDDIIEVSRNPLEKDYKTVLQEYFLKKYNKIPCYKTIKEEGPAHDRSYEVLVILENESQFKGQGKSKKEAQKDAARSALQHIVDFDQIINS